MATDEEMDEYERMLRACWDSGPVMPEVVYQGGKVYAVDRSTRAQVNELRRTVYGRRK